jgi:radical SAM protein with 4Fe4S-binding SPASM domain
MSKEINDNWRIAKKLTPSRWLNTAGVFSSYHFSRWAKRPFHWAMPISISIEPTTSCNLRCPECPSGLRSFTRPTGMLSADLFRQVIDELQHTLSYLTFYFQGEPYLHPQFPDMVRYASQKGIYTATSTNAHYLSDDSAEETVRSGLDRLIISIDGATQQTYESYRVGGSLDKVIDGTKRILHWKKVLKSSTPFVVFQFLVVKPNEHEIARVQQLGKELGVDQVAFKTAQVYDYKNGSPFIPTIEKYSRYAQQADGTYSIKNQLLNHCWKMWHSCVITWDGKVVPCCFDKDAHHVMGDLIHQRFREIWFSEKYNVFRSTLLKARSEIEMCRNCTEGMKVWA